MVLRSGNGRRTPIGLQPTAVSAIMEPPHWTRSSAASPKIRLMERCESLSAPLKRRPVWPRSRNAVGSCRKSVNQRSASCSCTTTGCSNTASRMRRSLTDRHGAGGSSYRVCYHLVMPRRTKRSVSLPPDLARDIERAATRSGTTFSGWLSDTAAHRLRLEAGRRAIAAWEREHGVLTAEECADGLARARSILGRSTHRSSRRSA